MVTLIKRVVRLDGYVRWVRRRLNVIRGDKFANPGAITSDDFEAIRTSIDEVQPKNFIEIGTGTGVSARRIFAYLQEHFPECEFYTIELFGARHNAIKKAFAGVDKFHPILGLSTTRDETTDPAFSELDGYDGPVNVLRKLIVEQTPEIDVAFIDSRKGTAVSEFEAISSAMTDRSVVFCHDILNAGKGVEVVEYLEERSDRFDFEVLETGLEGLVKIWCK